MTPTRRPTLLPVRLFQIASAFFVIVVFSVSSLSCATQRRIVSVEKGKDPIKEKFASGFEIAQDENGDTRMVASSNRKTPFDKSAYNASNHSQAGRSVHKETYASRLFGGKKAARHKTFSQSGLVKPTGPAREGSMIFGKPSSRDAGKTYAANAVAKPGYNQAGKRAGYRQTPEIGEAMDNASPPPIVADPGSGFAPMTVRQVQDLLFNSKPD